MGFFLGEIGRGGGKGKGENFLMVCGGWIGLLWSWPLETRKLESFFSDSLICGPILSYPILIS